ncbi:hypothetical protein ACQPX6_21910 [Actinomycetospora sp. CA-101289]|uniref:hypothetical protein n=1 Tax=Actinomycetospora sp. CA-101289 TaxID=3239893 RepID=UPI003D99E067
MSLAIPAAGDRAALADVVGRVVRLDLTAVVRLRGAGGRVVLWAGTPFEVLVTAAAPGSLTPGDVTVTGSDLLAALSVVDAPEVDPGAAVDDRWRGDLPGDGPWRTIGAIPAAEVDAVVARAGPSTLDETVWEHDGVRVPARCVVAVAGMGWPEDAAALTVALSGDEGWLRVEVGGAAIVRRRRPRLTVLV